MTQGESVLSRCRKGLKGLVVDPESLGSALLTTPLARCQDRRTRTCVIYGERVSSQGRKDRVVDPGPLDSVLSPIPLARCQDMRAGTSTPSIPVHSVMSHSPRGMLHSGLEKVGILTFLEIAGRS